MHALPLAEELKVRKVIVPVNSSVFSAWGMLLTDLRRDYVQTRPLYFNVENHPQVLDTFAQLREKAEDDYISDGVISSAEDLAFEQHGDMRYEGQEHTVKVPLKLSGQVLEHELEAATEDFHLAHEQRYTYRLDNPVQIVNFHLVATVEVDKPELAERKPSGKTLEEALLGTREVDFHPHGRHEARIYDGGLLDSTMSVAGPAVIQEASVTLPVPPGRTVTLDRHGNYHIELKQPGRETGERA